MHVDETVRREAILRCFRELHVVPGGGLYLKTLQAQWPDKGLRGADLLDGIEEMSREGLVQVEHDHAEADLFVSLSVTIADAVKGAWKTPLHTASIAGTLRKARKRKRPGVVPGDDRREADQ